MPLRVSVGPDRWVTLGPRETWQTMILPLADPKDLRVDENFYVVARRRPSVPEPHTGL
jgi:hypothetical protein